MALACGLGNPEQRYSHTPHNAGFWVLDALAQRYELYWSTSRLFQVQFAVVPLPTTAQSKSAYLLKPLSYMNQSGEPLVKFLRYHNIPPEVCLVVVDDVSLPMGTLRLRAKGGHGGHNGLRSIQEHLNTTSYPRLRFGVAPPTPLSPHQFSDYVLQPIPPPILSSLQNSIQTAVALVEEFLKNGFNSACDLYSQWIKQKKAQQ